MSILSRVLAKKRTPSKSHVVMQGLTFWKMYLFSKQYLEFNSTIVFVNIYCKMQNAKCKENGQSIPFFPK